MTWRKSIGYRARKSSEKLENLRPNRAKSIIIQARKVQNAEMCRPINGVKRRDVLAFFCGKNVFQLGNKLQRRVGAVSSGSEGGITVALEATLLATDARSRVARCARWPCRSFGITPCAKSPTTDMRVPAHLTSVQSPSNIRTKTCFFPTPAYPSNVYPHTRG